MTDDVTPECPRCHESHEALARERERTAAAATEMLAAMSGATKLALSDVAEARAILGAAPSETVQEAAARVARERDEARAETIEARRLRASLATAEGIYEDALVILGAADGESLTEAAARVVSERDEARDEVARLRAIIDGRTVPPTDAEIIAHQSVSGSWMVRSGSGVEVGWLLSARRDEIARLWPADDMPARWWPLDGDGSLCAWPVVTEDVSAHEWVTRGAVAVCARCGVVRSADRETPCRGSLPGVGLRERAAADGSALPPLPTSSTLRTRR